MELSLDSLMTKDEDFTFDKRKFDLDLYKTEDITRIDSEEFIRTYMTPNGNQYASVTSMLGATSKKDFLTPWKKKLGNKHNFWNGVMGGEELSKEEIAEMGVRIGDDIAERSSTRGNYMHDTLEDYVLGNDLPYDKDKAFLVHNLATLLNDNLTDVHLVEGQLWSDNLELAGTLDLFGRWRGVLSIIDYKNSLRPRTDEFNADYYIQSCIYAQMVFERYGIMPENIVILVSINNKFSNVKRQEFVVKVADIMPKLQARIEEFRTTDTYKTLLEMTKK